MKYLYMIVLAVLSVQAIADDFDSLKEVRAFTDKTMDLFVQKRFSEGLSAAKAYWPLPKEEIDGLVDQINQQWSIVD
ncbi:MAG: hypothetical protein QF536_01515 [Arenicellales bacterium]|nr:hypothetical protein [Arenicellales bacterium]MDP6672812.1 hypothetical protein [Arenicellales bacterium]MDP6723858.1 hypothetical protein [Arenicellales bacterium]|tara:strand:+ start:15545 stop:15775 length:231 start_codon:yes stop_codon:yes gene_type:complete